MNALQSLSAFGVVLILIGAILDQYLGQGILAGMFGIWGLTAIAAAVFVYSALWLNKNFERQTTLGR